MLVDSFDYDAQQAEPSFHIAYEPLDDNSLQIMLSYVFGIGLPAALFLCAIVVIVVRGRRIDALVRKRQAENEREAAAMREAEAAASGGDSAADTNGHSNVSVLGNSLFSAHSSQHEPRPAVAEDVD